MNWNALEERLSPIFGSNFSIIEHNELQGGDINNVYQITTNIGPFCLKTNDKKKSKKMFESESMGLTQLAQSDFILPSPIHYGKVKDTGFLLMEFIESGPISNTYWEDFGHSLANLHRITQDDFGSDESNYITTIRQHNTPHLSWSEFYREERLLPLVKRAVKKGLMEASDISLFEKLFDQLDNIFPNEAPSLIHGDLWSGNIMSNIDGNPVIIDPSVSYSHREMDLAMTTLFGGFSDEMYSSYHNSFPLERGWRSRLEICQLYPLLVHVLLFGGGYIQKVREIVRGYA